jgi:hypothetical protein
MRRHSRPTVNWQKEPETYLPEVAQTLINLGTVDGAQNRAEEARKAFAEALKIYRELAQKKTGDLSALRGDNA